MHACKLTFVSLFFFCEPFPYSVLKLKQIYLKIPKKVSRLNSPTPPKKVKVPNFQRRKRLLSADYALGWASTYAEAGGLVISLVDLQECCPHIVRGMSLTNFYSGSFPNKMITYAEAGRTVPPLHCRKNCT